MKKRMISPKDAHRFHNLIPKSELKLCQGFGHMPWKKVL